MSIETKTPINVTVTVPSGASAARFDEELLIGCFRTLRQDGAIPRTNEFVGGWDEFLFANLEINTYQDLTSEEKAILESAEERWVGMLAQMEGAHD